MKARTVEDVILGEATYGTPEERFRDMLAIASVIDNRARQLGVTPEEVISAPGQFSAYNRALPAGVDRYRALAKSALDMVKTNGPVHRATFYATPDAAGNLPSGLAQVGQTTGHIYFDDPANRPIRTSVGFRVPQAITAEYSPPYEMAATTGAFSPSMVPSANAGPAGRAYSDLVPPQSVETTAVSNQPGPGLAALAPNGLKGGWSTVGNFNDNVDPRLSDILSTAAAGFPDYSVEAYSGYRAGDKRQHGKHRAIDVRLVDPQTGAELANYQTPETFRTYEELAQEARRVQQEKYPELNNDFRWGGYFSGPPGKYGAADLMHFDLGGLSGLGMAGGSWDTGLTDQQRAYYPGAESIGLAQLTPDNVPTPTDRPMPEPALSDIALSRPEYSVTNASFSPDFNPSAQGNLTPSLGASTSLALDTPPAAPNTFDNMLAGMTKPAPPNLPQQDLKPAYAINADIVAPVPNAAPANMVSPDPGLFSNTPMSGMDFASFPKAPAAPSTWDKARPHMKTALKDALIGGKMLGVPGMLGGFALGMSPAFGADVGFDFGPQFDEAMPESERFSTGFGLKGIESAMHGPRGATGTASNGSTYTSLGNGMGLRHSARYGWTEVVGPDGSVRGIHYNNGAGGIFGDISRALEGFFGGDRDGGFSKAERDRYSKGVGLY